VFSSWVLSLNPTVNILKDDLERIPICAVNEELLRQIAVRAVSNAKTLSGLVEAEAVFTQPPLQGLSSIDALKRAVAECETQIDDVVFQSLGLSANEQKVMRESVEMGLCAVDEEESESEDEESDAGANEITTLDWMQSWVSYAVGTVLGRFAIGESGGLGCGDFTPEQIKAIRALIDADGVMPCEKGHPQDLAARAAACLALMLGEVAARDTIRTATGETGDPADALRTWLDRSTGTPEKSFWKYHHQLYRKRPIYWPLQSPDKHFAVWVFQERFTKETLFTVKKLAEDQHNLLQRRAADLRPEATTNRAKAKALDAVLEQVDDLSAFITRIEAITQRGYTPCIDDGVLLNAAPLHTLLPSWPETKKAWQELEGEKYEWAHQAMIHWPDRVKAACKTNKSFAIAHGLA
jgi:hypothetical protein